MAEGGGDGLVTVWKTPGSVASIEDGFRVWAPLTPGNLAALDDVTVRATGINATSITNVLRSYDFGFTDIDIPAGATITGVEIEIVRKRTFGSGVPFARHARLSIDSGGRTSAALADQIGQNNTTDVEWLNTYTTAPCGGPTDTWGASLTPELIKSANFGFDYGLQGGQASMDASLDQLRMRVHYTAQGGGGARAWTPDDLTDKLLWLDMDDPSTIAFSSYPSVSTLTDKSGAGRNATSANPPTHTANAINGRPAAYFLTDRMSFTDIASGTTMSAFFAFRAETPQTLFTLMGNDTAALLPIGASNSASNTEVWRGTTTPVIRKNGSTATWANRGAAHTALTDSQTQVLALTGMTLSAPVTWLGAGPFSYFFRGLLGEVLFVEGAISGDDTARIEGYLAHKWGTAAALPESHPFKSDPPTVGTPAPARRAPRSFYWL